MVLILPLSKVSKDLALPLFFPFSFHKRMSPFFFVLSSKVSSCMCPSRPPSRPFLPRREPPSFLTFSSTLLVSNGFSSLCSREKKLSSLFEVERNRSFSRSGDRVGEGGIMAQVRFFFFFGFLKLQRVHPPYPPTRRIFFSYTHFLSLSSISFPVGLIALSLQLPPRVVPESCKLVCSDPTLSSRKCSATLFMVHPQ